MAFFVIVLIVILVITIWKLCFGSPKIDVPGPWDVPFLGHWLILGKGWAPIALRFELVARIYGEVFRLIYKNRIFVVLCNFASINEALTTKLNRLTKLSPWSHTTLGISSHKEELAQINCRSSTVLNDYTRKSTDALIKFFESYLPKNASSPNDTFFDAAADIASAVIYGSTIDASKVEELRKLHHSLRLLDVNDPLVALDCPVAGFGPIAEYRKLRKELSDWHGHNFPVPHSKECLWNHVKGAKATTAAAELHYIATEMLALTGSWGLVYFTCYPIVQRRVQEELDSVLGDVPLKSGDIDRLPYLHAAIRELLRMAFPLRSVACKPAGDLEIQGWQIPREAIVVCNLVKNLRDDKVWPDSFEFRPDRFLTMTENGKSFVIPSNLKFAVDLFGCPGLGMSVDVLFLMIGSLLQRFQFVHHEGPNKCMPGEGEGHRIWAPKFYKLVALDRKNKGTE